MAVVYSAALHLLGVPHALSIGVLASILTLVPLLGVVGGALLAIGAAALSLGEAAPLWAIVAVFIGGNLLENFVVTPRLVGERIGLHPLTVIFALLVFGKPFGAQRRAGRATRDCGAAGVAATLAGQQRPTSVSVARRSVPPGRCAVQSRHCGDLQKSVQACAGWC
jgi:hypothetical protein